MKRINLGAKIAFGFGLMILMILALGMLSLWNMQKIQHQSGRVTTSE